MSRPKLSYYSFDSSGNPWLGGGAPLRDIEILKRFSRHADVTLFVGHYDGFESRDEAGVTIRSLGFGSSHLLSRLSFVLLANLRVLFDRATIIGNSTSSYAPLLLSVLRRRRCYGVFHHYAGRYAVARHGIRGWLPWLLEQGVLRTASHYIVSNPETAAQIQRLNPRARVFTTFNAFDPALLDVDVTESEPPFILFIGRFDIHMKGLDLLLHAYEKVAAPDGIDLVLAGRAHGNVVERIEELIPATLRHRIRIEQNVSEVRRAELLSSCLFFASASRIEGFGIAALEANAAGKAVLATEVDGFQASLEFGETALAVPPDDLEGLADGMARLVRDAELRERLGRKGRMRAAAISWDLIAEREWQFLQALGSAG